MDTSTRQALEAILFVVDEPIGLSTLSELLEQPEPDVEAALRALAEEYEREQRGLAIRPAAGGWRMYTAPAADAHVERFVLDGRTGRLTQASLETLAVIAYRQPISRQEVSEIRGVNADGAVRSLAVRGYIQEVGRDEGPGQAILYGTTTLFLERLGIDDLDDLPPLTDFLPEGPAPDEPALDRLREARKRLASGGELASTGRPGRDALDDRGTNTGDDLEDSEGEALPPAPPRVDRGDQDAEMDDLTDRLERAARSAMAQLRTAVQATESPDDDEEPDGNEATGGDDTPEARGG